MMNSRTFKTKIDDKEVEFLVRSPSLAEQREGQKVYNQAFSDAVKAKAIVRARMEDLLEEQGLWDAEKQAKLSRHQTDVLEDERTLARGGISLSKAKDIAMRIKDNRMKIRELISVKTSLDNQSAEGQADNARFNYLVSVCLVYNETKQQYFKNLEDYMSRSSEKVAILAAQNLANMIYNLDNDYENNLPENKFLKKYKFVDEKLRLINKDGKLVDEDGRLIDENGRFINEAGEYIDKLGNRVDKDGEFIVDSKPFLDDNGNPIVDPEPTVVTTSTTEPVKAKEESQTSQPETKETPTTPEPQSV